jgi:hypothetical protein
MSSINPKAIGLEYAAVVEIVDKISSQTGLRAVGNFETLLLGMGGKVERSNIKKWNDPEALSLRVSAPRDFTAYLPPIANPIDKMLLACCLGHYVLHAQEGKAPSNFYRFCKDQTSLEGLWFGMAVVIPDTAFELALATEDLDDEILATLFSVPPELIALKRKLVTSAKVRSMNAATA